MDEKLTILYEDEELIVCHKPAGVPVQSAKIGQKDMVSILNACLTERAADQGILPGKQAGREKAPSIYVVHRLDQPVEGVLVFAKTRWAAADLSGQVSDGSMKKVYRAVCCASFGEVCTEEPATPGGRRTGEKRRTDDSREFETDREYCLVDYLVKDGRTNTSSVARQGSRDAKRAELSFCIKGMRSPGIRELSDANADADRRLFLVEIKLKTGRHHQIRVQMAHAGLPLYGDRKYNGDWQEYLTESDRFLLSGQGAGRVPLALCSVSLTFRHPVSKKQMTFEVIPRAEIFSVFSSGKQ